MARLASVRWQLEQAEEFRQRLSQYTDAQAGGQRPTYQALLRSGPLPGWGDASFSVNRAA